MSQKSPYLGDYVFQHHGGFDFVCECPRLARNTSRLFKFVNKFGNKCGVWDVFAIFI